MAAPNLVHTSILNILMDVTAARLLDKLRTSDVLVDDDARAGLVRTGKLQDDPTNKKINILVHPGEEEWPDIQNTVKHRGLSAQHTIGGNSYGSTFYLRRYKVELSLFYANEGSRNYAREKSNVVLSRAIHALCTQNFAAIPRDSFGEKAYMCFAPKSFIREGGGEGDFNWRGEIWIEYHTELEFEESLA